MAAQIVPQLRYSSDRSPPWTALACLRLPRFDGQLLAFGRSANCGSSRAGVHGIAPPGLVSGAAVERLAGGPADVAGAHTGLAEKLGGAHDQGRPDPLPMQRRGDTNAADGP